MLNEQIHQAMQNVCYNLNTMHSRAGSQVPFSSLNYNIHFALLDEFVHLT